MTNCVHKTLAAVRAIEDVHVRRSASFKLLCASVLFSIKKARDKAEIGTLKLLIRTRWFDATDRRDKVFALVGLTSDINQSFVDYSKSYEDLMRDLNLMLLEGRIKPTWGNVLDVLSLITREEDDEIAEPSWVVDVFKPQNFEGSYTPVMGGYPSKEPHIQRKPELRFPEEYGPECLRIRGTVFDTIAHTAPFPTFLREGGSQPVGTYDLQNISAYRDWLLRVDAILETQRTDTTDADSMYRPTGESHNDAFWRTLCCNRTSTYGLKTPTDGSSYHAFLTNLIILEASPEFVRIKRWILGVATASSPTMAYYFRGRNWFLRYALPFAVPLFAICFNVAWSKAWESWQDHLHIKQRDFQTCHMAWMWGRQFAITEQGLIGLVPVAARVGDSVGFFAGCRVPYALRRRGEGYVLIGDSYLHGVMDGEGEKFETEMLKIM
ncbi:uncharacterized protein J4E87_003313 [Alternaria ethzedia]|uniref:uncharacterized protein n=1 Tax=Alternaria ethzedia TaxID=181014 RepID=UPI0020C2FF4B|nr:uncharacterized protein J4E87_003313 [Alternaria ethzedia]KAI4629053.1 hypothetical protein J4E87_003313 [Alternaria ethzedia]